MIKSWLRDTAVSRALLIFIILRLFFSGWAILMNLISPVPTTPDETLRPYLGEPQLSEGAAGLLLGPWQRFDTQHYLRIARQGYANEADSVFPPLYPWLVRGVSTLLGGSATARIAAALLISNLATLGLFIALHKFVTAELGSESATRTLIYLALFPTGFFLFSAYTESLFLLLALGSFWAGRNGRFWLAGTLGFLAASTRLTGWVLVIPLLYEEVKRKREEGGEKKEGSFFSSLPALFAPRSSLLAAALPGIALVLFMVYRWWLGLPPLNVIYEQYWYQTTSLPGRDVFTAVSTLCCGGAARSNEPIQLTFDLLCTLLLLGTTYAAFRRLGAAYGLYSLMLLFFMLLPTSPVKPLYSFSRYTLAFFPTFMLLGLWGKRPLLNRLILYPSLALTLFFSGQFVIWGWVA
ncbi:MAG: hypothetical protein H6665_16560 [Ardenticatenaceae bacterium]|nr:hypothetical protein [Ardenticatenaceae bacterium]